MARSGPPAYAWDWFSRQRLLWREARSRIEATAAPVAARYRAVDTRAEVIALLRSDYGREPLVREVVDAVVTDVAFLGRTDVRFGDLGIRNPPRGLAWWWTALTGEDPQPQPVTSDAMGDGGRAPQAPAQLRLDDVQQGWGG